MKVESEKIKIVTIIGARPQIIKAAAISRAISNHFSNKIEEYIVHTGQHYDENMSEVFFDELGIPRPAVNLSTGSGTPGAQIGKMSIGLEEVFARQKPTAVLVYGDTNSTLAAAVVAAKMFIPIIHVEAGLRSYNKKMPEELNRIVADHSSTLLFSPTMAGIYNLAKEGFVQDNPGPYNIDNPGVFHCGDIMLDNSLHFAKKAGDTCQILSQLEIDGRYILSTIHRDTNTDDPIRLKGILSALNVVSKQQTIPIVLPLHPRTAKLINQNLDSEFVEMIKCNKLLKLIPPVSFLEMIALEKNALMVVTDSGGVQKEAYFFEKPCIILRDQTEWIEIVENGCARLTGANEVKILEAIDYFMHADLKFSELFGDGRAAEFICKKIVENFTQSC